MAIEPIKPAHSQHEPSGSPSFPIQVFKLRRQNRQREPLPVNAALVRQRTSPLSSLWKPKNVEKRQRPSATPPTQTTITVTTTSTQQAPTTGTATSTLTVVVLPPITLTSPLTLTLGPPEANPFAQQTLPTGGLNPGSSNSGAATVTVTESQHSGPGPTTSFGNPTTSSSPDPRIDSQARLSTHRVPVIVGSVIGGLVVLLIILALCYRWRKHSRGPGPIFLTDPFDDEANVAPMEQHQRGPITDPATPSPFILDNTTPVPYTLDNSSPSPVSSPRSGKHLVYGAQSRENVKREDSIATTTHSPPSIQAGSESMVTMADLNALRARILEIENLALRQRINDVENMARAGSSAIDTTLLRPPRASESPPEYASPIEARGVQPRSA